MNDNNELIQTLLKNIDDLKNLQTGIIILFVIIIVVGLLLGGAYLGYHLTR